MKEGREQLWGGQLGAADVTASTVANIGPGIDFYFRLRGHRGHRGVAVFRIAFDDWIRPDGERTLSEGIRDSLEELRQVTG